MQRTIVGISVQHAGQAHDHQGRGLLERDADVLICRRRLQRHRHRRGRFEDDPCPCRYSCRGYLHAHDDFARVFDSSQHGGAVGGGPVHGQNFFVVRDLDRLGAVCHRPSGCVHRDERPARLQRHRHGVEG
ncbi:MAG: hypothetical protein ACK55I_43840, partial [bacterium]